MKFSADSKSLVETIGRARKVCPKATEFNLVAGKKGAFLVISSDGASAKFKVPNMEIEEAGDPITVPINELLGSVKGRKVLNFDASEEQLAFNDGGKYKGHLVLPAYTEIELQKPSDGVEIDLSDEQAAVFHDVTSTASLSGAFGGTESMTLYLSLGQHGITALCYDSYYLARITDNSAKFEDQAIAIDTTVLGVATAVAGRTPYKILVTEDSVYAYNGDFMLRQSAIQVDSIDDNIKNVNEFIDSWLAEDSTRVTSDLTKFREVFDNMSTFTERGVPIEFVVAKKGVEIRIDGKGGNLSEKVEGTTENSVKDPFKCEFLLLSELLPKLPGPTVEMSFVPERVVYFHTDSGVRKTFLSAALVSE